VTLYNLADVKMSVTCRMQWELSLSLDEKVTPSRNPNPLLYKNFIPCVKDLCVDD